MAFEAWNGAVAPVPAWLARAAEGACPWPEVYGTDGAVWPERQALLRRTLSCYGETFGEGPVRVFRAPGRVNLRGMHVDTHGGWLNLSTHQREVVVVAGVGEGGACRLANVDPVHGMATFDPRAWAAHPGLGRDWLGLINSAAAASRRAAWAGRWGVYAEGALLRAAHAAPAVLRDGLYAAVGSDLPAGAALSSSAALGVALLLAALGLHGAGLPAGELVLAARDAEWFTGSRCGVSDQAAVVLGRAGQFAHLAPYLPEVTVGDAGYAPLPPGLAVLVADSRTVRSISGAQKIAYTRNRFAYSMALDILRQEMAAAGLAREAVARADRLSRMTPDLFGGEAALYGLLARVPEALGVEDLRRRYDLPGLDAAYAQYFGDLPPDELGPVALRGPLLYGLAESERARQWPEALRTGDGAAAGRLMTAGHDGDRVVDRAGRPFDRTVSDAALAALAERKTPLADCAGDYGASTPALDGLVDAALGAGALGASLTGAGLAGCVLVLCRAAEAEDVAKALRGWLASEAYAARTGKVLPAAAAREAVVVSHATAGAGELPFET